MSEKSVDSGDVNAKSHWVVGTLLCLLGNKIPLRIAKDSGTLC